MLDVHRAEDIDLPVFRASDASYGTLLAGHLSLSLALRERVHVTMAYFSLGGFIFVSAPRYGSEQDYYTPMRREVSRGDWRLDNFLRERLEYQPGRTAERFESRVADLWEIAGDPASWADLDLVVDGEQVSAKAFLLGGEAFVRALLPDCDLEIGVASTAVARLPAVQRMTIKELQPILDKSRRRRTP